MTQIKAENAQELITKFKERTKETGFGGWGRYIENLDKIISLVNEGRKPDEALLSVAEEHHSESNRDWFKSYLASDEEDKQRAEEFKTTRGQFDFRSAFIDKDYLDIAMRNRQDDIKLVDNWDIPVPIATANILFYRANVTTLEELKAAILEGSISIKKPEGFAKKRFLECCALVGLDGDKIAVEIEKKRQVEIALRAKERSDNALRRKIDSAITLLESNGYQVTKL